MFNFPTAIGVISGVLFLIISSLSGRYFDGATPSQKFKANFIVSIIAGVIVGILAALLSRIF